MTISELSEPELRSRLRGIAAEHRPDRTAMLNRIARHRVGPPVVERRPAGQALRLAGSALAVATVLGVGGFARWALADDTRPGVVPVAPPVATSPAPAERTRPVPSSAPVTRSAESTPAKATAKSARTPARNNPPTTGAPAVGAPPSVSGAVPKATRRAAPEGASTDREVLRSAGSVAVDTDGAKGDSRITLEIGEPVSALEVTVRVALTPGLTDRGATHDVTGAGIGTQIFHEPDALVYHFELARSATLPEGTYVFIAKYAFADKAAGRDTRTDTYQVTATTAQDAAAVNQNGDFF